MAGRAADWPAETKARDIYIDVGTSASTNALGFGWSRRESSGGRTFAWVKRMEADVWFDADEPQAMEVWLEAQPFLLPDRNQQVGLYVNHRFVAEWQCPGTPSFATFRAEIPEDVVHGGRNRLTLRVGYLRKPARDKRELALAVDRILLRPVE